MTGEGISEERVGFFPSAMRKMGPFDFVASLMKSKVLPTWVARWRRLAQATPLRIFSLRLFKFHG